MIAAAAATLLLAVSALHLVPDRAAWFGSCLALHAVATAAFLLLCVALRRGTWRPRFLVALLLAVALRAIAFGLAPSLSDDLPRYLWEGKVMLRGWSPYRYAPDAPELEYLRDELWRTINHKQIPAAYPPAVQYCLMLCAGLAPSVYALKALFGSLDLLVFVALWRLLPRLGCPRELALVHGLCPLLAVEFAGEGHSDSLAVLALVLAVGSAAAGRRTLAAAWLGLATAAKLLPAAFLPFLVLTNAPVAPRALTAYVLTKVPGTFINTCSPPPHAASPSQRHPGIAARALAAWTSALPPLVAFTGVVLLLYLPFLSDPQALFAGATEYAARWRSNDTGYALVHAVAEWATERYEALWDWEAQRLAKLPLAAAGCALLLVLYLRKVALPRVVLLFLLFFVAFTPTLHAWYLAWLVPSLCLVPNLGLLAFTGTVYLSYHVLPAYRTHGAWEEDVRLKVLEYLPFYAGAAWVVLRGSPMQLDRPRPAL